MDQHSPPPQPRYLTSISVQTKSRAMETNKNEAEIVTSRFCSTGVSVSIIIATMSAIIFASVPQVLNLHPVEFLLAVTGI